MSGYFRDPARLPKPSLAMMAGACRLRPLNPVHPDLHACTATVCRSGGIDHRGQAHPSPPMVLVDVDSERTSPKISATAEELEAALELARRIRDYLCQVRHWRGPSSP